MWEPKGNLKIPFDKSLGNYFFYHCMQFQVKVLGEKNKNNSEVRFYFKWVKWNW